MRDTLRRSLSLRTCAVLSLAALGAVISCKGADGTTSSSSTNTGTSSGGSGGMSGAGSGGANASSSSTSASSSSSSSSTSASSSSSGSMCSGGQQLCNSQCVTVAIDAKNCGSCGHDCQGGQCSGGQCQPVVLTSVSQGFLGALCQYDDTLYWAVNTNTSMPSTFDRMHKAGGAVVQIASGFQVGANSMVTDGVTLFYLKGGTLFSVPVGGGTITTLYSGFVGPTGVVALSGSSLVWGDKTNIHSANKDGTGLHTLWPYSTSSLAVDTTTAYFAYPGTQPGAAAIEHVPIAGGTATALVSPLSSPVGLTVYGGDLYFADGGYFYVKPTGGGNATTITTQQQQIGNVLSASADASGLYFGSSFGGGTSGKLFSLPLAGGTLKTLATGLSGPFDVITDATAVYWIDSNKIMMVAK
jgi:hypothetical protein